MHRCRWNKLLGHRSWYRTCEGNVKPGPPLAKLDFLRSMAIILITGGSGLIGTALTASLRRDGHEVRHLSRTKGERDGVVAYRWDIPRGFVDPAALRDVDHIVHLAGAGIADKRWTEQRVQELIDSRALAARLLLDTATREGHKPRSFISAAGINFYGTVTSPHVFTETDPFGTDTMGRICREWEAAADDWMKLCRVVKLRTPFVLARTGPLKRLSAPIRWGLGAPLGSGKQWMPWVHIDDLVRVYHQAMDDPFMSGAYHVNTGNDVTNAMLMRTVAEVLHRPFFLPAVPALALRLVFGELSVALLEGSRASNVRLLATGFQFRHTELREALQHALRPK